MFVSHIPRALYFGTVAFMYLCTLMVSNISDCKTLHFKSQSLALYNIKAKLEVMY